MDHLVSLESMSEQQLADLLDLAERFAAGHTASLEGRIVCTAFFEPSTRTRLSFEAAAHRLGAQVIGFSDANSTSATKGESLEDSVRILSGYADVLVLRHPETGSAQRATKVSTVPVINAGDGSGEHPTQTLVDLLTMRRELGDFSGRTVAIIGDLRYGRTVHSLIPVLQRMGATVLQVPAPGLEYAQPGVEILDLEQAAAAADVLYLTRIQKERFPNDAAYESSKGSLRLDAALLKRTRSKAIVLHPLPRVDELADDVDALPAAKYFDQARNGVPVRMAVLATLLEPLS